jgi:hypothetical protein
VRRSTIHPSQDVTPNFSRLFDASNRGMPPDEQTVKDPFARADEIPLASDGFLS